MRVKNATSTTQCLEGKDLRLDAKLLGEKAGDGIWKADALLQLQGGLHAAHSRQAQDGKC